MPRIPKPIKKKPNKEIPDILKLLPTPTPKTPSSIRVPNASISFLLIFNPAYAFQAFWAEFGKTHINMPRIYTR